MAAESFFWAVVGLSALATLAALIADRQLAYHRERQANWDAWAAVLDKLEARGVPYERPQGDVRCEDMEASHAQR